MGGGGMFGSLIQSGSAILQTGLGSIASNQAKNQSLDANTKAQAARDAQYGTTQGYLDPYNKSGRDALGQLNTQFGDGGHAFTLANYQQDPGYQFRLDEGMKALERTASARGMTLSGAQQKALQGYAQGMASQEFQNAYNRYNTDQGNAYNRLYGMANMGMNAAGQQANYSNQQGNANAQSQLDQGALRAGNTMGQFRNWQVQDSRAAAAWGGGGGGGSQAPGGGGGSMPWSGGGGVQDFSGFGQGMSYPGT